MKIKTRHNADSKTNTKRHDGTKENMIWTKNFELNDRDHEQRRRDKDK